MARTVEEMHAFMESQSHNGNSSGEYLKFERVKEKLSRRADLHALVLLDRLSPPKLRAPGLPEFSCADNIISGSDHDVAWLSADPKLVAENATDEELVDLVRCGVFYDEDVDAFSLFT